MSLPSPLISDDLPQPGRGSQLSKHKFIDLLERTLLPPPPGGGLGWGAPGLSVKTVASRADFRNDRKNAPRPRPDTPGSPVEARHVGRREEALVPPSWPADGRPPLPTTGPHRKLHRRLRLPVGAVGHRARRRAAQRRVE